MSESTNHFCGMPVPMCYDYPDPAPPPIQPGRDEIFCQLIKQTTKNAKPQSNLMGLKLLYLCISTFSPSPDLLPCLWSHLAQWAHPDVRVCPHCCR